MPNAINTFFVSDNVPTKVFLGKGNSFNSEGLKTMCCSEASLGFLKISTISSSKKPSKCSSHSDLIFSIASIDFDDMPETYSLRTNLPLIITLPFAFSFILQ